MNGNFRSGVVSFIKSSFRELLELNDKNLKYEGPGAIVINSDMSLDWQPVGDIDYFVGRDYSNIISYQKKEDKYAFIIIDNSSLYKLYTNGVMQCLLNS